MPKIKSTVAPSTLSVNLNNPYDDLPSLQKEFQQLGIKASASYISSKKVSAFPSRSQSLESTVSRTRAHFSKFKLGSEDLSVINPTLNRPKRHNNEQLNGCLTYHTKSVSFDDETDITFDECQASPPGPSIMITLQKPAAQKKHDGVTEDVLDSAIELSRDDSKQQTQLENTSILRGRSPYCTASANDIQIRSNNNSDSTHALNNTSSHSILKRSEKRARSEDGLVKKTVTFGGVDSVAAISYDNTESREDGKGKVNWKDVTRALKRYSSRSSNMD